MFFILKVTDINNISIIDNSISSKDINNKMTEHALEFIRDEEGTKKSLNAFIDTVDIMHNKCINDGFYLIKGNNKIDVYSKKTINGYLTSQIITEIVFSMMIVDFNFNEISKSKLPKIDELTISQNFTIIKTKKMDSDTNSDSDSDSDNNFIGFRGQLLDELKERLSERRVKVKVKDD